MDTFVIPAYILAVIIEISLPILILWYLRKKLEANYKIFLYGAGLFLFFQVVHFIILLLINDPLTSVLLYAPEESLTLVLVGISLLFGLLAGIIEEVGRYLSFKYVLKKARDWKKAMVFGAGWGGIESIIIGLIVILSLSDLLFIIEVGTDNYISILNETGSFTESDLIVERQVVESITWVDPLLGALERISTLIVHISLSILVMQVFTQKKIMFLWISIILHTLFDTLAILLVQFGALITEFFLLMIAVII
jgi:uncharacterized membrane protein YhfC